MGDFTKQNIDSIAKTLRDCEPDSIFEKELWEKIVHTFAHDVTTSKDERKRFRKMVFGGYDRRLRDEKNTTERVNSTAAS